MKRRKETEEVSLAVGENLRQVLKSAIDKNFSSQ